MKNELVSIIEKYEMGGGFERKYLSNGMEIGWGTDKNSTHSFCDFYEKHFSTYKNKEISILEIGCNYGCSAIMWHDFLPKSNQIRPNVANSISGGTINFQFNFISLSLCHRRAQQEDRRLVRIRGGRVLVAGLPFDLTARLRGEETAAARAWPRTNCHDFFINNI